MPTLVLESRWPDTRRKESRSAERLAIFKRRVTYNFEERRAKSSKGKEWAGSLWASEASGSLGGHKRSQRAGPLVLTDVGITNGPGLHSLPHL